MFPRAVNRARAHMAFALSYCCGACRTTIGERHLGALVDFSKEPPHGFAGILADTSVDASRVRRECRQRLRTCSISRRHEAYRDVS